MDGRVLCSGFTYLKPRHSRHDDKCGLNVNVSNLDTKRAKAQTHHSDNFD